MQDSERTVKVFHLANQEAQLLNASCIETEHVLLGIIKEGGQAARRLLRFGINLTHARNAVRRYSQIATGPVMGVLRASPQVTAVKNAAATVAESLQVDEVEPLDVLIALLQCDGNAKTILHDEGVTVEWLNNAYAEEADVQLKMVNELSGIFVRQKEGTKQQSDSKSRKRPGKKKGD